MSDTIYRATALEGQFRIFAVSSTQTAQHARDIHDLSPLPTIMMGRLISALAMMSLDLKSPEAELSLRLDGEGPLKGALGIINGEGHIRAYSYEPHLFLDQAEDNFRVGKNLLPGTLTLIRSLKMKNPYTGTIELISGEIGDDLAYYYQQSEQIPTAVNLGVLIDPQAKIRAAGGFMIQQMPGADLKQADILIKNLKNTPNVSDLMDMGLGLPEILERFVLQGISWTMLDEKPLLYQCNCSRERFARGLLLLGKEELQSLSDGISPVCHYCNTSYHFDSSQIKELIDSL